MNKKIVIFGDMMQSGNEEIFVGYFVGKLRFSKGDVRNSRMHSQPNRIYSALGIHPSITASETQGRYWILTYEDN